MVYWRAQTMLEKLECSSSNGKKIWGESEKGNWCIFQVDRLTMESFPDHFQTKHTTALNWKLFEFRPTSGFSSKRGKKGSQHWTEPAMDCISASMTVCWVGKSRFYYYRNSDSVLFGHFWHPSTRIIISITFLKRGQKALFQLCFKLFRHF